MQDFDGYGPARRERPWSVRRATGYRPPRHIARDGASLRMVAAMAEPCSPSSGRPLVQGAAGRLTPFTMMPLESDAQYYRRRAEDERRAAGQARMPAARAAHQALADHYARLSRPAMRDRPAALGPLSEQAVRSPVTFK